MDWSEIAVLALLSAVLVALVQAWIRRILARRAAKLAIRVDENVTVMIADDAREICRFPNTLRIAVDGLTPRPVAFGVAADSGLPGTQILNLAVLPPNLDEFAPELWSAFLAYCCTSARKALDIGPLRYLQVLIRIGSLNETAAASLRRAASRRDLAWLGQVTVEDRP